MERTWMPTVAGILNTITGVFSLIGGLGLTLASGILISLGKGISSIPPNSGILAVLLMIIGILATVGGIYALTRKMWVVALVGSVFASVFCFPLGIPAIIFTALSKNQFD